MKELKINVPDGYEIDKENSTFECIKFKKKETIPFAEDVDAEIDGYYISNCSAIVPHKGPNKVTNYNLFATHKQAQSALAMARISQIMANDERFGGVVTDKEWNDYNISKYVICKNRNEPLVDCNLSIYEFLAFHTAEQRDLFLEENEDLVKEYLMLD